MIYTVELVANMALDEIGYPRRIGSIYEGSEASRIALDLWAQTRDTLLRQGAPDWATAEAILTQLKAAPGIINGSAVYPDTGWTSASPDPPWLYEYQCPADCVEPMQVRRRPLFLPEWRPRNIPWRQKPGTRTILCNEANALLVYTKQVLDPNDWQVDFVMTFVAAMAKQMEARLRPERHMRRQQQEREQQDAQPDNSG